MKAVKTDSDASEVPEVGWMWQTGGGNKAGATRANLKQANIKAKKSLGQNFLTDEAILASIVAAAGVTANDVVLEIGPGTGNLTRFLVATGAQVIAVEKDDTLVERLREEFAQTPNIQLIHGDILRVGIPGILEQMQQQHVQRQQELDRAQQQQTLSASGGGSDEQQPESPDSPQGAARQRQQPEASTSGRTGASSADASSWRQRGGSGSRGSLKVVANLPYNITKDFLKATLPLGGDVSELSIMIQHEVAERLVDPTPGRPDYRAMSIYTHYYSMPKYRLRIPRQKYFPVPGVDGALVTFKLIPPPKRRQVSTERGFHQLVNKAFSERRKMMRNSMQPLFSAQQVEAALSSIKMRPEARAQELTVDKFVELYRELERMQTCSSNSSSGGGGTVSSDDSGSGASAAE